MAQATETNRQKLDPELRKLRAEIGRMRRRLDRRAMTLIDRSLLFSSWRDYVAKYPGRSLFAAAGAGMAMGGLASGDLKKSKSGARIYDSAISVSWIALWDEFVAIVKSRAARADNAEHEDE